MKLYVPAIACITIIAFGPNESLAQEASDVSEQAATVDDVATEIPAAAGDAAAEESVDAAKEDPGKKMVCKSKRRTGTRIFRKTCLSANQWSIREEQQRLLLERVGDNAGSGGFSGNPHTGEPAFGPGG